MIARSKHLQRCSTSSAAAGRNNSADGDNNNDDGSSSREALLARLADLHMQEIKAEWEKLQREQRAKRARLQESSEDVLRHEMAEAELRLTEMRGRDEQ